MIKHFLTGLRRESDVKFMIKKVIRRIIMSVQKVLIIFLLTLVYFICFGITYMLGIIFYRRFIFDRNGGQSYWIDSKEEEITLESCLRQS